MSTADVSAPQPNSPQSPGRIVPFGKYLLLQRVSVGGMAEIFKAVPEGAKRLDNILAIKRILPSIAEDAEFIGMFVDEARIAGQLTHPNIGRIYELGKVGDTNYIAMQFLWGRDLLKVINRFKRVGRNTPPPLVAFVGAKACAGLHYAHTKRDASGKPLNIIHRDVSPQNISLGYSGQVKLIDFGVARAASQNQKTQAGVLKGKFGYMSPEMVKGFDIDARSDVFAMGICLWEALTGQRLFYGESDFATLELVREAQVDAPSTKADDIPAELDAIVLRALAADPDERFQSAEELQKALEQVLSKHYPSFRQADVGVIMQQAFALEVKREQARLASFQDMMSAGKLVRGAELPPLPNEDAPTSGDRPAAGVTGAETGSSSAEDDPATVVHPVSDEDLERLSGSFETVHEEATTIFFSADELEEIAELSGEEQLEEPNPLELAESSELGVPGREADEVLVGGPPASEQTVLDAQQWTDLTAFEGLPVDSQFPSAPPPPSYPSTLPGGYGAGFGYQPTPAPTFPPPPQHQPPLSGSPSQTLQMPLEAPGMEEEEDNQRSATIWLVMLAVLIGMVTYFGLRSLRSSEGELTVDVSGPDQAVVKVDGVLRGYHPLHIDDLTPGTHQVDVEAQGYRSVRREVAVERGRATLVRLVMLPDAKQVEAPAPAVAVPPPSVTPVEPLVAEAEPEVNEDTRAPAAAPAAPRTGGKVGGPRRAPAPAPPGGGASLYDRQAQANNDGQTPALAAPAEPSVAPSEPVATTPVPAEPAPQPAPLPMDAKNAFPPRAADQQPATLTISTLPWSRVFVDGKDTGRDTPVSELKVAPGKHTIGMRTSGGAMHTVEVDLRPGQKARILRRFVNEAARY